MRFTAKSLRSKSVSPINRTNERNILLLPSRNPWKTPQNNNFIENSLTEKHITIVVVVVFFSMSNDLDLTHPFLKQKEITTSERIRILDINL
jgi:hypothetical protein